jgi:hypothetical protein
MIKYFSSLPTNVQVALTVLASLAGILSLLLAFYQPAKDFVGYIFRSKPQAKQPKLAISLSNRRGGRHRPNDRMYAPFELGEDRVITYEQQELISYDWALDWRFTMRITNHSDYPAYKVKLAPLAPEKFVTITLTKPIDFTKVFAPNETVEIEVVCTSTIRSKWDEADRQLKVYPFPELRLDYANVDDQRFVTVFSSTETDDEKKNVYSTSSKPS